MKQEKQYWLTPTGAKFERPIYLPCGWDMDEAYKAYGEWSIGAESGRSFEAFIKEVVSREP